MLLLYICRNKVRHLTTPTAPPSVYPVKVVRSPVLLFLRSDSFKSG